MANSVSTRKPAFVWQSLLILLPVAVMAIIGWAAILRDRNSVEQEARQRAQELLQAAASELVPKTWNQLAEYDAAAGEWFGDQCVQLARLVAGVGADLRKDATNQTEGYQRNRRFEDRDRAKGGLRREQVFPNWLWLDQEGQIAWPPDYEKPPRPPEWLLALTPSQRQLWNVLQGARATTNPAAIEAARTQLLNTAPQSVPKANLDFLELEWNSAQEEPSNAVARLLLFAQQHPFVRSESGIPLSNLAIAAALRDARQATVTDPSWLDLFRLLLQTPSALTGELLERARSVGLADPVFRETLACAENIWFAQEGLRRAAEAVQQRLDRGRESGFSAPPPFKLSRPISSTQLSSQWFPVGD